MHGRFYKQCLEIVYIVSIHIIGQLSPTYLQGGLERGCCEMEPSCHPKNKKKEV